MRGRTRPDRDCDGSSPRARASTEEALDVAVNEGATQLVMLGAGFDTLAYRTPLADRLRIFEVDHPATQARKREMLAAAGIPCRRR